MIKKNMKNKIRLSIFKSINKKQNKKHVIVWKYSIKHKRAIKMMFIFKIYSSHN